MGSADKAEAWLSMAKSACGQRFLTSAGTSPNGASRADPRGSG